MAAQVQIQTPRGGNGSLNYVGDTWAVIITGAAPNAAVASWGIQNGNSNSPNAVPVNVSTDANGNAVVTGAFDATAIGNWVETWFVGGVSIGSVAFTVAAAPVASTVAATSTDTTVAAPVTVSGLSLGFLSDTLMGVPVWILGAAGLGLYFFTRKGR